MTSPRAWNLLKEQQRGVPLGEKSVGNNGASLEVEVPLEAIVFRPRKWQSAEGSAQSGDSGGFVGSGSQPHVDGAEGTQQRFWVAPAREEQGDVSVDIGESLESASILVENDWSMDSGSEGLYTLATTGSCLPVRSDITSQSPPEVAGTSSALRPTTPPLLGSAIAGTTLSFLGGSAETPPSARRTVQTDVQTSRRMAGHSSTPQIPIQSSADGTRLRAPSPDVSGRSWSAGARRFDQQSVPGSRPKSPRPNNRTGTPATRRPATENRSRSGTPSKNLKRFSTGSIRVSAGQATILGSPATSDRRRVPRVARESGERLSNLDMNRRARSASPEDCEDGHVAGNGALGRRFQANRAAPAKSPERSAVELEAENHQLRVEVSHLRAELRVVLRELLDRTQDLREVSSLLARHQGNPSTSNLGDGLSDGRIGNISGAQLSDISADSIIDNGAGHSSALAVPSAAKNPPVRVKKGCSLGLTPPPTPSPRVDPRVLRNH